MQSETLNIKMSRANKRTVQRLAKINGFVKANGEGDVSKFIRWRVQSTPGFAKTFKEEQTLQRELDLMEQPNA